MTPKLIVYSTHATGRMVLRGISRADVRGVLATGLYEPVPTRAGGEARHAKRAYLGGREAKVVYVENATRVLVLTVEWTDERRQR